MKRSTKFFYIVFVIVITGINSYAQENTIINPGALTRMLLCSTPWKVDQFYIDSLTANKKDLPVSLYHFYSSGNFNRSNADTLIEGIMYWDLIDNNQIKISVPSISYIEYVNIIYLSNTALITRQDMTGSDGRTYTIELRFIPYVFAEDDSITTTN